MVCRLVRRRRHPTDDCRSPATSLLCPCHLPGCPLTTTQYSFDAESGQMLRNGLLIQGPIAGPGYHPGALVAREPHIQLVQSRSIVGGMKAQQIAVACMFGNLLHSVFETALGGKRSVFSATHQG